MTIQLYNQMLCIIGTYLPTKSQQLTFRLSPRFSMNQRLPLYIKMFLRSKGNEEIASICRNNHRKNSIFRQTLFYRSLQISKCKVSRMPWRVPSFIQATYFFHKIGRIRHYYIETSIFLSIHLHNIFPADTDPIFPR